MKDSKLVISEKFYSLQGEGQTMGVPSIFVRLAGCNILCQSASWVCDTIEVWRKGISTSFEDVLTEEDLHRLKEGVHLIFTGGEPLLHQKAIFNYLEWLNDIHDIQPVVEVETNGTIMPSFDLCSVVDYWNCSPKLENSGEPYERRVKPLVIQLLNKQKNTIFKFVISEKENFISLLQDYGDFLSMKKVCLMPAGESQEKLNETRQMVAKLCINQGLRYSERLHIVIWNQKTGV